MIAGHTDIPVGTAATSADDANCDGASSAGTEATTGGISISGDALPGIALARKAANATVAATQAPIHFVAAEMAAER